MPLTAVTASVDQPSLPLAVLIDVIEERVRVGREGIRAIGFPADLMAQAVEQLKRLQRIDEANHV